jgi:hypothetical protein
VCKRLAQILAARSIPPDVEDSALAGLSRQEVGNFYLLLVAICHQTSPRGRPPLEGTVGGQHKRGWDYLSAKLEAAVQLDRSLVSPNRWADISVVTFCELFRDETLGDRLLNPELRTPLVQDLGRVMLRNRWRWAESLYEESGKRVVTGSPNLLELLAAFTAYRDPVRKKSLFFLSLMRNSGLWRYPDEDKLGPPVDYHEVRGHLRIGTVCVTDPALRRKLMADAPVTAEEDIAIRRAVYDAIMLLSDLSGLRNPSQLHYLFWNVFRTHCRRDDPLCHHEAPALPRRYQHLAVFGQENRCPFSAVCASASDSPVQRYYEHLFETDYY